MESLKSVKIFLGIILSLTALYILETYLPIKNGLYVGLAELGFEAAAARRLYKNHGNFLQFKKVSQLFLTIFFASLLWADFWYILLFYILNFDYHLWWAVMLTTGGYVVAFLAITLALLLSFKEGFKKSLVHPVALIPIILFIPIALNFIISPYLHNLGTFPPSFYSIAQGGAIFATTMAVLSAFMALISSRSIFWSNLSLGVLTLVFGDWSLRVELFNGMSPQFGFYEYFWALGVLLSASAVLFSNSQVHEIEKFDLFSLLCSYKLGSLTLLLLLIGFQCIAQYGNVQAVKLISFGSSIGVIISVLVSDFLAERVHYFAEQLALVVASETGALQSPTEKDSRIPSELADTFQLIFQKQISEQRKREKQALETRVSEARKEIIAQVVHDIRSPLAALEVIAQYASELPEDQRGLLRNVITRIRDVANNLFENNKCERSVATGGSRFRETDNDRPNPHLFLTLVENLVSEKRLQFHLKPSVEISIEQNPDSAHIFAWIEPTEFKRVLSNLIDNAVEAIDMTGRVILNVTSQNDLIQLQIQDTGKGIPENLLPKIGNRGVTFGKKNGTGLGIYHAKQVIEDAGGSLRISSIPGHGTCITIALQKAPTPDWFVSELRIPPNGNIIILDDDKSVHKIWRERLKFLNNQGNIFSGSILNFVSSAELISAQKTFDDSPSLYLIDHDLGHDMSGLVVIEKLCINNSSVLVTNRPGECWLQQRCLELGVKFLEKTRIATIPIIPITK